VDTLINPILASDTVGPVVALFFLAPIVLAIVSLACIPINRTIGRRKWWGLVIALIPMLGGALLLFFLATVRGGAPQFMYMVAVLPFLVGLRSLLLWRRPIDPRG
jgi:drug/metabolite transporter (DMT)-like permease